MSEIDGVSPNTSEFKLEELNAAFAKSWMWLLACGIAIAILGVAALVMPIASTLAVSVVVASYLGACGILYLIEAFKFRHQYGYFGRFFLAILALAISANIYFEPALGLSSLTLALATYFLVASSIKWSQAILMTSRPARFWSFMSATITFAVGVFVVFDWPLSALQTPGILLGIEFLFSGAGLIGVAMVTHRQHRNVRDDYSAGLEPLSVGP
jgi:uncharacterized membrane protein HdeD (DUF308 family)